MSRKVVTVLMSGGMDSTALAFHLADAGYLIRGLSFEYGQRHRREVDAAREVARALLSRLVEHRVVKVQDVFRGGRNALVGNVAVPHGHYAAETMKVTVVPNRNAFFLASAFVVAGAAQDYAVATAVHAGDHFIYPDCRPGFIEAFKAMANASMEGGHQVDLLTPFLHRTKTDIARIGHHADTPWELTWTCYEGGWRHCGLCGACQERKEAFHDSGIPDLTTYKA